MWLEVKIPKTEVVIKPEKIIELIKGKKVCHIGAIGDAKNFEESLHVKMREHAKFLLGIDVDKEAIELIKQPDIIYGNVEEFDKIEEIKNIKWDVIVAADVIEHTKNPGEALERISKVMSKETKLIVTLPNAFSLRFIYYMLRHGIFGREMYLAGHTFWPTYATFMRLIKGTDLEVESFYFSVGTAPRGFWKIAYKILKKFPIYSPGLFFILRKKEDSNNGRQEYTHSSSVPI
ncbi:hypothetical protein A3L09_10105 [Thermococcus profundus]|uniref:Uncharacterized protein n=1 Tax=Thermococcus profundus TaxID=49899 RepID=A0A2Z2MDD9_THEPR|nr:methyltransferase domain-containing protein [Thermococcus profundus]ASJ03583.1 hypothetical protein A3L09_10105 [Thermococcus profundus]